MKKLNSKSVKAMNGHEPESPVSEELDAAELKIIAALENIDDSLPKDYQDEMFAVEVLENLAAYHKSEAARRAARHQGEHDSATKLAKQAAVCRTAAALIQYEHPNTVALYKVLAEVKVMETRQRRQALLEGDE